MAVVPESFLLFFGFKKTKIDMQAPPQSEYRD